MTEIRPTPPAPAAHDITLKGRGQLRISGVREVISFDEQAVRLHTVCGELMVEGEALHIGVLDIERGVVALDGTVDGLYYSREEPSGKKGLLGKLMR